MASKPISRSMRFSEATYAMIEQQAGENFSAKFETLVTRCCWELPSKEKEEEMSFITEYADAFWSMSYDVAQMAKVVFAWGLTFLAVFFVGAFLWTICSIIKDKFTRTKTLKTSSEYCRKHNKPIIEVDDRDRQKCLYGSCIYCHWLDRKENIYGK